MQEQRQVAGSLPFCSLDDMIYDQQEKKAESRCRQIWHFGAFSYHFLFVHPKFKQSSPRIRLQPFFLECAFICCHFLSFPFNSPKIHLKFTHHASKIEPKFIKPFLLSFPGTWRGWHSWHTWNNWHMNQQNAKTTCVNCVNCVDCVNCVNCAINVATVKCVNCVNCAFEVSVPPGRRTQFFDSLAAVRL